MTPLPFRYRTAIWKTRSAFPSPFKSRVAVVGVTAMEVAPLRLMLPEVPKEVTAAPVVVLNWATLLVPWNAT